MAFRRGYSDLPRGEALKMARNIRKRPGYKAKVRKDPNGRYEVWIGQKGGSYASILCQVQEESRDKESAESYPEERQASHTGNMPCMWH